MQFDFSKTVTADHRRALALLAQIRAKAAEWPSRWASAKKAGNPKLMKSLLTEAEALGAFEKVLRAAEIQMRCALLDREHFVNNIMLKQNREKEAKAGTSFSKRLALKYQRASLENALEQIDQQTVQMGQVYCLSRMADLVAGGMR